MVAVSPENDVGTAFQQECCQSGARIVLARCRTDAPRASTIRVNHQDSETRRACVDLLIASCPPSFRKRCQKRVQGSLWDSAPWGGNCVCRVLLSRPTGMRLCLQSVVPILEQNQQECASAYRRKCRSWSKTSMNPACFTLDRA